MTGFRALVVEDEAPALEELRYGIREAEPLAEVDAAASAVDALRLLKQHHYDAVFVDIQMPGVSGLELVELMSGLADRPPVVFVTAYDEHAVRAFELRAMDYVLKPVSPDRLRETIDRLRGAGRAATVEAPKLLDRLAVEAAGRTMLIDLPEIRYVESRDDIVYVHTRDREYPTRFSLNDLEQRLPHPPFLRIRRGCLANMRNVVEIMPHFNGAYLLHVNDDARTELTVSRGRVKDLRTLLGL